MSFCPSSFASAASWQVGSGPRILGIGEDANLGVGFAQTGDGRTHLVGDVVRVRPPLEEVDQDLFQTKPGATEVTCHFIPSTGNPVRVPPRHIPAQYRVQVQKQLEEMLDKGIIEESSSPWMAPAVNISEEVGRATNVCRLQRAQQADNKGRISITIAR